MPVRSPTSARWKAALGCICRRQVEAAAQTVPPYRGKGQPRKRRPAPLYTVKELIAALPEDAWQTISWRQGTKGTMKAQVVAIRVHWATGSPRHSTSQSRVQTGPEGWLLAERPRPETEAADQTSTTASPQHEEQPRTKYWFCMLPKTTPLERLVTLAHARWVIEQF
jgi:hypothetical protein